MERLTKRIEDCVWYLGEFNGKTMPFEPCEVMSSCSPTDIRKMMHKLAGYEDSLLTPEELAVMMEGVTCAEDAQERAKQFRSMYEEWYAWKQAEQEGRLKVFPCEEGATLYKLCPLSSHLQIGRMWGGKIITSDCDRCAWRCCDCHDIGPRYNDEDYTNVVHELRNVSLEYIVRILPFIGTIYFTTREAAEAALEKGKAGGADNASNNGML